MAPALDTARHRTHFHSSPPGHTLLLPPAARLLLSLLPLLPNPLLLYISTLPLLLMQSLTSYCFLFTTNNQEISVRIRWWPWPPPSLDPPLLSLHRQTYSDL